MKDEYEIILLYKKLKLYLYENINGWCLKLNHKKNKINIFLSHNIKGR